MTATDDFIAELRDMCDHMKDIGNAYGVTDRVEMPQATLKLVLDVVEMARSFGDCCTGHDECNSSDEHVRALANAYISLEAHLNDMKEQRTP